MIQEENNIQEQLTSIDKEILRFQQIFGGAIKMTNEYLPTGNEMLDSVLGGGYKKGLLTELSGSTDTGKTLLALKAVKEVEKENKLTLYITPTGSLNSSMLEDNNIDKDSISILYMNEADMIGPLLTQIVKPCLDDIGLIVIDSLADLTTTKEKNSPLKANTELARSKIIKSLLTRLSNLVRNTSTCVLIINQERVNIVDNESQGVVSSSERWVDMCCDTRVKLSKDEDDDTCVEVKFKERKL